MELKGNAVSGVKWTTVSTLTTSIVHILRLVILTRFLEKEDFGLIAILTFILGLTQTFSDLGFSTAIMHKKNLTGKEFSSLYWIQMLLFVIFFCVVSCFSGLISSFYNEPSLVFLVPVMLSDLLLQGLGKLYDVLLNKNMLFKTIAIRNVVTAIVSLLIAVILAYFGAGVYSLVVSALLNTLILQLWNFVCGQRYYRIIFHCSFAEVKPLVKIGAYQMGTQLLDYLSSKMDILILGRILGTESLGVYNLAKELVLKLVSIINSIANKVAMPVFSIIQDDDEGMRNNYCMFLSLLSFINFPCCLFIGVMSTIYVPLLYGSTYSDVAPIVSVLSVWGLIVCIANPVGNIVTAKGRTDMAFYYTVIRIILYTPAIYILSKLGLFYVSIGQIILAATMIVVAWYLELYKTIYLPFTQYTKSFMTMFVITFLCIVFGYYCVSVNIFGITNPIFAFIVYVLMILLIYTSLIISLSKSNLIQFLYICQNLYRK